MNQRRDLLQESLAAIERLQARLAASEGARHEPIAIVGAGCRYAGGVDSPEALWRILREGVDAISEVPAERWDADAYYDPDPKAPGKMITKWGGFLPRIDQFDARFFGISPREAATMDPQQRLLLETSYEALESAGLAPDRLVGSLTGVFIGITTSDYGQRMRLGKPEHSDVYSATGGALNAAAGRISFNFGFQGPCVALDTACSSSLVAVHMACQSLRARESNLALAGGVNIVLSPDAMVLFSKWGMMAPDGRCKTFDAAADGFVRSEGCAVIALKRLSDALAAGDPILAVIRGSAVNSDGRSSGLTVPNGPAQEAVMRSALADARLSPGDIDYVEAHGTGTSLGDPIEVEALGAVLGPGRAPGQPVRIGSIKTNLGHTEASSGLAGLLKVVMSLRHEAIPPHLHFKKASPAIPWATLPLEVPTSLTPWPRGARPRRAGVSSFGFSGTNAHAVLEEAPLPAATTAAARSPAVVVLSGMNAEALSQVAAGCAGYLREHPQTALADVSRTMTLGRAALGQRAAFAAESVEDVVKKLDAVSAGESALDVSFGRVVPGSQAKVAFMFPGQGAQWAGMARELAAREVVVADALAACAVELSSELDVPLLDLLNRADLLDQTKYTQPALFAVEWALSELWRSWGVRPAAVIGHSVGEYVAACVAGVMDLKDGLRLIAARGRLMQELAPPGAMAAILSDEKTIQAALAKLPGSLAIAAVNAPDSIVVSGRVEEVLEFQRQLEAQGVRSQRLAVSHAFHSALLEPMLDSFAKVAAGITFRRPTVPLYSNLTGARADVEVARPEYWVRHAREPVRFAAGLAALLESNVRVLLETGPGTTLIGLGRRCSRNEQLRWVSTLRRDRGEALSVAEAVAHLWSSGAPVDMSRYQQGRGGAVVDLPTYPFQRERHWTDGAPSRNEEGRAARSVVTGHPLLGERLKTAGRESIFESRLGSGSPDWLTHHGLLDTQVVPSAVFVEMALAAAANAGLSETHALEVRALPHMLALPDEGSETAIQLVLTPGAQESSFEIASQPDNGVESAAGWRVHARGRFVRSGTPSRARGAVDVVSLRGACREVVDISQNARAFHGVKRLWRGPQQALANIEITTQDLARYRAHPLLLEACFQVCGAAANVDFPSARTQRVYVPKRVAQFQLYMPGASNVWVHAAVNRSTGSADTYTADVVIFTEAGAVVARASGVECESYDQSSLKSAIAAASNDWLYEIEWQPLRPAAGSERAVSDTWLLLADRGDIADALISKLRARGDRCVQVQYSDSIDFDSLLVQKPTRIVHLWSLAEEGALSAASLRAAQDRNCRSLLNLVQAIARSDSGNWPQLSVVTRGAVVTGERNTDITISAAPLAGLARVVTLEHPQLQCCVIDLDTHLFNVEGLYAELTHRDRETFVALRANARLGARLIHSKRSGTSLDAVADASIVPDATYLITGGLGGLGLEVARAFVEAGARSLVLLGRSAPADRARKALDEMRDAGAKLRIEAVDVADRAVLERLFVSISETLPPLAGIVHAAGVLDDGVLVQQSWDRFERVFRPKIEGAWHLHELSAHLPLRFFVLFSSAAALIGSPGQGNYTAANAFLDALARYRRARGLAAVSIAWGAWGETGMAAARDARQRERSARQGVAMLEPAAALSVLRDLLHSAPAHVGVLNMDWAKVVSQYAPGLAPPLLDLLADAPAPVTSGPASLLEQLRAAPEKASEEQLLAYVRECVGAVVGMVPERITLDAPLVQLGLDSLMAVEVRNRVERAIGPALPLARYLDGSDVVTLTRAMLEQLHTRAQTPVAGSDDMALLDLLPGMSDEEVEAHLARLTQGAGG